MERLTERWGEGDVWVKNHDYVSAAYRLADYEDTGLTPQACAEAREAGKVLSNCDISFRRLVELLTADRDGRLVVPPCKVGDTVYFRTYDCNGTVNLGIQPHKVTAIVGSAIVRGRYTDVELSLGQYGVSWFLTREEAEEALRRGDNA